MLMKSYHYFFTTVLMAFHSLSSAQDIHLQNGNTIKTIKANTFISLQLRVPDQQPCLKCDLNYLAGQLISYENGNLKLRLIHADEVIVQEKKNVGFTHRSFKNETDQPVMVIPKDSILTITKRGTKKFAFRSAGDKVGMFLALLGASNILSAPLAEAIEKDSAIPFVFVGLGEIVAGGIIGSTFSHKTLITSPEFPQKRNKKKIWLLN